MNRFKFRIWDNYKYRWVTEKYNLFIKPDGSIWGYDKKRGMYAWDWQEHLILQQWTGLTDKEYQPIFEGDIVKLENSYIRVVRCESGEFGLYSFDAFDYCYESPIIHPLVMGDGVSIIGNIFQNEELLENKNE